jgi:hypothetical protein
MSSKFFINGDRNLLDKFTGILENMKDLYAFYAVVDYFRSSPKFSKNVSKESKAKKNGSAPRRFSPLALNAAQTPALQRTCARAHPALH